MPENNNFCGNNSWKNVFLSWAVVIAILAGVLAFLAAAGIPSFLEEHSHHKNTLTALGIGGCAIGVLLVGSQEIRRICRKQHFIICYHITKQLLNSFF